MLEQDDREAKGVEVRPEEKTLEPGGVSARSDPAAGTLPDLSLPSPLPRGSE